MGDNTEVHLYVIMWPNYALVASNCHLKSLENIYSGSSRYFHGQVVFAEIDPNYRHEFLNIDKYISEVKPDASGAPKRTKFIATYRVLEHIDLEAFRELHITSTMGKVLTLKVHLMKKNMIRGIYELFKNLPQ